MAADANTVQDAGVELPSISVVVIGRNEGQRLTRCLQSVRDADYPSDLIELIYVDTDSTDDSRERAERLGARVIVIRPERPSAATGRNAGLDVASGRLVHFLDGDTVLDRAWLRKAVAVLADESISAVFGRREEMAPNATIYNFWMHHDWYVPPGRVDACGGDVMFRRDVLVKAGGYDPTLIAGEERDLCFRLIRDQGVGIVRLDEPMTLHDINMTRFDQYWRRCVRSGHAYAQVAARYPGLKKWRRTCVRNLEHVALCLAVVAATCWLRTWWPIALWAGLISIVILRDTLRCREQVGAVGGAFLYALHHYLSKVPTVLGHLSYYRLHCFGGKPKGLVEYRGDTTSPGRGASTTETHT